MNSPTLSCLRCLRPARRASVVLRPCTQARHNSSFADDNGSSSAKGKGQEGGQYRKTIFSGIQPTGIPHLGNYLGALRSWRTLQSLPPTSSPPPHVLYTIVSLHALTLPQDPLALRRSRRECLAALLACGIGGGGEGKATLFFQEDVGGLHTELSWILGCLCGVGKLERMTGWKSKITIAQGSSDTDLKPDSSDSLNDLKLGLLSYPVLQAADILLYKATDIPVGEDQQQHLELARDLAGVFNSRFGETFPLPQPMIAPSKRVLSLTDPSQKMSKSAPNPLSRILITDTPSEIKRKIKGAVTDSDRSITWDPVARRGVANLLTILAACSEGHHVDVGGEAEGGTPMSAEELAANLAAVGVSGHAQLKGLVAEAVVEELRGVREEYGRVLAEEGYLMEEGRRGGERAREVAQGVLDEVRRKVGLGGL